MYVLERCGGKWCCNVVYIYIERERESGLPLEWIAKLKCVEFWYRVRKLGDEILVKRVAVEAWKQREMKWMKDLRQSIREMGWGEVKLEDVEKLSNFQLKEMLKSCAWREVRVSWEQEMSEKPKLEVLRMTIRKMWKKRFV